ncbi:hypothetical protein [Spirosoma gilvum]
MLSQYSWGDLIKVVLVALIIYYAYVLIKYYREDIREWISSRGNKPDPQPSTDESEETDYSELYAVSHYAPVGSKQPVEASQSELIARSSPYQSASPVPETNFQATEPDLNGIALDQDELTVLSMPIPGDAERPAEQSVAQLISAAQRLQANDKGILIPDDPTDVVAANLAEVINQQQNRSALAGISFTR